MEHFLQPMMEFLRLHPYLGLLVTFGIAFIESLPLLGTLFPGSVTMTAIGVLIGATVLPGIPTFFAAVFGAFLGDCIGFWLGYRYHAKIRSIWPFNKMGKWLNYGEKFFAKHGSSSIIIGRFIGPTRAAMPLIAGLFRFTWKQFLPSVIIAALLWSLIYMLPGIFLGALALEFPPEQLTKVFLCGLIFIVCIWLIFWVTQFFFKQLTRAIHERIQLWWEWLNGHRGFKHFTRLIKNHQNPEDYGQLSLTILFLISGILLLILLFSIQDHSLLIDANQALFYFGQSTRSDLRDKFWVIITILGTPEGLLITSFLVTICLLWKKQWRTAGHLIVLCFLTTAAIKILKSWIFSERPEGFLWVDPSSSFPSGHTTMSVAVLGFLAFLSANILPKIWSRISTVFFVMLIFLISLSRLFLGQHWITDVLAGWCLGACVLLVIIISYRRMPKPNSELSLSKKRWFLILSVSLILPWLINIYLNFQNIVRDTTPDWPKIKLNYQQWWQHPTQGIPIYRKDRFGRIAQPFNVQWAGNLKDINNFLISHGWQTLEARPIIASAVARFSSLEPEQNMPLLDWLYQNKPPAAFFIRHVRNSQDILELRLWNSGAKFSNSTVPLWIGIVTYHTPPEKLLRFPHQYIHVQSGHVLLNMSPQFQDFQAKLVRIPKDQQPERIRSLHWDGQVFILRLSI